MTEPSLARPREETVPGAAAGPALGHNPDHVGLESVGWVSVRDGRLLVVRTRGRDAFYLPGGKPEPDETGPEAVVREVYEELGVVLRQADLAEAFTVEDRAHGQDAVRLRMTCYTGTADGDPVPRREIEELAWLGPADADRCAPAVRQVLRRLAQR